MPKGKDFPFTADDAKAVYLSLDGTPNLKRVQDALRDRHGVAPDMKTLAQWSKTGQWKAAGIKEAAPLPAPQPKPRSRALTARQQRFVEEYLIDLNASQAAVRAGYSAKTAGQFGYQLLQKPSILAAIQEGMDKRAAGTEITAEKVLRELALIGFANMADFMSIDDDGNACVDLANLTREQAAAIQEIVVDEYVDGRGEDAREVKRVRFKLADKKGALVEIGRHLGMFSDGKGTSVNVNVAVASRHVAEGLDLSKLHQSLADHENRKSDQRPVH